MNNEIGIFSEIDQKIFEYFLIDVLIKNLKILINMKKYVEKENE